MQRAAGPDVGLIPMVKADAYGLGAERVVSALVRALPRRVLWGFGVAAVAEGERLRVAGWEGRILVVAPVLPGEYARAARAELAPGISDLEGVGRWREAADAVDRQLAFHTEVDTGMGRAGFAWREAAQWGADVTRLAEGRLSWEGCFTHFHSADEPDLRPTEEQCERFQQALAVLPAEPAGEPRRLVHAANSAAALRLAGYPGDLIRPGIFLYGGSAGAEDEPEPVVSVRARVALIRQVPPGSTVGYGATYRSGGIERWGTLAIGYGDGIRRSLVPAGGGALVAGRRVPLIGRISMDMSVVDLSGLPRVAVGEVATLIGRDGEEEITLDHVAELCGTISYEILTGLTPRLPRVYLTREAS